MIVGLGHQTEVGKDTAASELGKRLGAITLRFSEEIKAVAYTLFKSHGLLRGPEYEKPGGRELRQAILPGIGKSPEQIWIEIGSKMREIYEPVWCDLGMKRATELGGRDRNRPAGDTLIVFTDVRSLVEAEAVKRAGGVLIKITRSSGKILGLDELIPDDWGGWHAVIENDGTPSDLGHKVETVVRLAALNGR